ncbi:MAG: ornithine cyclodeaminase family protein [Lachnospiraceae bacterium]|nr:ornithine cyclodeaminase family protein [Lachnospiraceae bacterium]
MKIFSESDVRNLLSYPACISLMKKCFSQLDKGEIQQPVRSGMGVSGGGLAYMPCYLAAENSFGAKIISVYPGNAAQGFPSHQGVVLLFEGKNGVPAAMADACAITEIRTAAASAAATDLLARKDSHKLAIIGSGAQARTHLAAMRTIREITEVTIWSYHKENAVKYAKEMSTKHPVPITVCNTVQEAVRDADIICTLCRTREPLLELGQVKPGAHINAAGTCSSLSRDLSSDLVAASRFYIDQMEACLAESGNYLIPLAEGRIQEGHIVGSIGEVINGKVLGRRSDDEITVFESLGLAAEDVICADYLYKCSV